MSRRILICDDDELLRALVVDHAEKQGAETREASDGSEVLPLLKSSRPDVLLLDLQMPGQGGLETLEQLQSVEDAPPVVVMTADERLDSALEATRRGAYAYVSKPLNLDELFLQVERAHAHDLVARELRARRERQGYGKLIGSSTAMRSVFQVLEKLEAAATPTVLICGESGTGKDLVAQAIHAQGPRASHPFMEVDCASLPEHLIESELFGHEKGAFTDARAAKPGLFEAVGEGTLFLDEIGEMPLGTQSKLLRALENRAFKRVGGLQNIELRAAVSAATNRDLAHEVKEGRFREDLYFRLNVVPVEVPPLRDRPEDIASLAEHFLERFSRELNKSFDGIHPACLEVLERYSWPGNVRELRNLLERVVLLEPADGPLLASQLPLEVRFADPAPPPSGAPVAAGAAPQGGERPFLLPDTGIDLEWLERDLLLQALERTNGARKKAAELLGITRHALRYRLQKHGLEE